MLNSEVNVNSVSIIERRQPAVCFTIQQHSVLAYIDYPAAFWHGFLADQQGIDIHRSSGLASAFHE
jgi:hypothetical protein